MLAELSDPQAADIVGEYVVYKLGPRPWALESMQQERLALMSTEEKSAILQFIRYMQERYGGFEVVLDYFERKVSDNKN